MDILDLLKIVSLVVTLLLIVYGFIRLPTTKTRLSFTLMNGFFLFSALLFWPEGVVSEWLKHIPFYIGQFWLYLFLHYLTQTLAHDSKKIITILDKKLERVAHGVMMANAGGNSWFTLITEQGLQHILTVPLMCAITALTVLRLGDIAASMVRRSIVVFLISGAAFMMIHFGEFVVEAQGWLPILEGEPIEIIEFVWYFTGMGLSFYGLTLLSDKRKS